MSKRATDAITSKYSVNDTKSDANKFIDFMQKEVRKMLCDSALHDSVTVVCVVTVCCDCGVCCDCVL